MTNKKQVLSQSILGGVIITTKRKNKRKFFSQYNDFIVRLIGTVILIVFICLHFFLSYHSLETALKKENNISLKLDYGFGAARPFQLALVFFCVDLILIGIEFIVIKGWWKIIVVLFGVLFVVHYLIFLNYNTIIIDLIFWISLGVNSIVVIFYKN